MENVSALEKLQSLLVKIWKRHSDRQLAIKAYHCEFAVEPKMFLADGEVNPEVMKLLINLCIERAKPEDYKNGRIKVLGDKILIHDHRGNLLVEVTDQKLVAKAKNPPA